MSKSKLFKLLVPLDVKSLSMKDRILSISIYTLPFTLFSVIEYFFIGLFTLELLLIFYILFFPIAYYLLAYEKLEKKYKIYSDIRFGNTFEFFSKMMASFAPGIILLILAFSSIIDKLNLGILISFSFVVPALALFLRTDVFNDKSCLKDDEKIFGYNPIRYGPLSLIIGLYGYINVLQLPDMRMKALLFTVTLIFQILFIVPDQFNKILPFEVREIKGFLKLTVILIVFYAVSCFLIQGNTAINFSRTLSLEYILRHIITWSTAIIITVLLLRQIKKMNSS